MMMVNTDDNRDIYIADVLGAARVVRGQLVHIDFCARTCGVSQRAQYVLILLLRTGVNVARSRQNGPLL